MIYNLREHPADKVMRLSAVLLAVGVALLLVAVQSASLWLFFVASVIAGFGFGGGRAANRRVDIRLVPSAGACSHPAQAPDRQPPVAYRDV